MARAQELREKIEQRLAEERQLQRLARQVRVTATTRGVRIDLVDDADFSMFALGTTVLNPEARKLIEVIAPILAEKAEAITVRGHTDALPWRAGRATNNWSLSAGRAEATRVSLLRNGIPASRIERIEGVAETEPLITDNPEDPRNRRMSIMLLQ